MIDLSGVGFGDASADSRDDPYLTEQLLPSGTLLDRYALLGDGALANDVALLSGQAPNSDTEQGCPTYSEVPPSAFHASTGLAHGPGCVYPASVLTLPDQLATATLTWRAYIEDLPPASPTAGATATTGPTGTTGTTGPTGLATATPTPQAAGLPTGTPPGKGTPVPNPAASTEGAASCPHPALGALDTTGALDQTQPYAGFRNPFVYFDSLLASGACAADDLSLEGLAGDLADPADTPALSWIAPSRCDDGSGTACAPTGAGAGSPPAGGQAGALAAADAFLTRVVPAIERTAAYRQHGLIVITSDSPSANTTAKRHNKEARTGGRSRLTVGALLISPFVRRGATVESPFNPYSLLKSLERLFGLPLLGHAADQDTASFGASIYRSTKQPTTPDQ